jgi:hypothetical protein
MRRRFGGGAASRPNHDVVARQNAQDDKVFSRQTFVGGGSAMLLMASAMALSLATVKVPGGRFELLEGCSGPDKIGMAIDAYMGLVACDSNKMSIMVEGSAMSAGSCLGRDAVALQSRHAAPLRTCLVNRIDGVTKLKAQTMVVDFGVGSLRADIKDARQALILLNLALSFRADRR